MTTKQQKLLTELENLLDRKIEDGDSWSVETLETMVLNFRNVKLSKAASKKGRGIAERACRLLAEVKTEFEGVEYGRSYDEILSILHEEFPGANTKLASLQWYETKMRKADDPHSEYGSPKRPRIASAPKNQG